MIVVSPSVNDNVQLPVHSTPTFGLIVKLLFVSNVQETLSLLLAVTVTVSQLHALAPNPATTSHVVHNPVKIHRSLLVVNNDNGTSCRS